MIEQITPQNLLRWAQNHAASDEKPLIIDVREPWEWAIASIEPLASCELKQLPMGEIPSALNHLDPDRPTALLCHHGVRSQNVANFLHTNGFSTLANIVGGIDAWSATVDSSVPTY
ncbi:sulfurtransferase [Lampropedia puyangensis]|uniref:Sulfurtransferase n=1 Tax=Lampropedia puyangensis TaxID=1330072 RepID=A0A4S8F5L7_9BURK|nr:rhodanese-like domain-containing protein [Lampropedia puyangensis]THU02738.1 sulfurtransferase [Lampropedia puyangensis]